MIKQIRNGLLGSNTYIFYNEESKHGVIIDCGCRAYNAVEHTDKNGIIIDYIILTHGHFDHVDYIDEYVSAYPNAKLICHEDEIKVLLDPEATLSAMISTSKKYNYPYITVCEGDIVTLDGGTSLKIIHSPGHTPGSMCLLCEDEQIIFTGDVLFASGYGRTDFKHGSYSDMIASLKRLLSLNENITFFAGHNEASKIGNERCIYG